LNKAHCASHPGLSATFAQLLIKYFAPRALLGATLRSGDSILAKTLLVESARSQWQVFCPAQAVVAPIVFDRKLVNRIRPLTMLLTQLPGVALKLDLFNQDSRFSILPQCESPRSRNTADWNSLTILEPQGFAAYWSSRPSELSDNLRRRMRRADKDQLEFRLDVHLEPAAIAAAVDRFGVLETRGWKGREGSALHPDNVQGRFFRELLQTFATAGMAKAFELRTGERLAASRLLLFGRDMGIILKTTYDEAFRQYSAGHVLLHHVLRDIMESKADTAIEFYSHASREQLLWATRITPMQNVCIYRSRGLKLLSVMRGRVQKRQSVAS
jgi:hypothetical protein